MCIQHSNQTARSPPPSQTTLAPNLLLRTLCFYPRIVIVCPSPLINCHPVTNRPFDTFGVGPRAQWDSEFSDPHIGVRENRRTYPSEHLILLRVHRVWKSFLKVRAFGHLEFGSWQAGLMESKQQCLPPIGGSDCSAATLYCMSFVRGFSSE